MSIDPSNPDHLAFIAFGFDGFKKTRRRHGVVEIDDEKLTTTSRFLDSLTHLAIPKSSNQVVAVGADLKDDGVNIIVAENNAVDSQVIEHIQHIMAALYEIRHTFRELERQVTTAPLVSSTKRLVHSFGYIADDDTRLIPSLLRELELSILRHSPPKASARIRKDLRYSIFIKLVKRFLTLCDGTSATGQEGGYEGPKMSPPDMRRLSMTVEIMRSALKNPSQLTDQNLADFRLSSSVLEDILTRYTEDMTALATFFLCV